MFVKRIITLVSLLFMSFYLFSCSSESNHLLCGKWISEPQNGPLSSYLILSEDGSFLMGDIDKGKEYLGITGKWKADKTSIILKINTSQSCKVKEGQEIKASYIMNGKQEFEISESGSNQKPTIFRRQNQSGVDERK